MNEEFWEDVYGSLQCECGYTPDEIGQMTMHDVMRLNKHWQRVPPLRILVMSVAKSLGVEFKSSAQAEQKNYPTDADARRMIAETGGFIEGAPRM